MDHGLEILEGRTLRRTHPYSFTYFDEALRADDAAIRGFHPCRSAVCALQYGQRHSPKEHSDESSSGAASFSASSRPADAGVAHNARELQGRLGKSSIL